MLVVDYSIGFGGATKSMALMLDKVPDSTIVVMTSQKSDVRRLWYSRWRTYGFRRLVNYRSKAHAAEWMSRRNTPAFVCSGLNKLISLADAVTSFFNVVKMVYLIRRHRIEILHLANGFLPPEALVAARLTGVHSIAHLRGFFPGHRASADRRYRTAPSLVIGDSHSVSDSYTSADLPVKAPTFTLYEVVDVGRFGECADARGAVRARWGIEEEAVLVGIFGRVVRWKGQREYVLAMIEAMNRDPRLRGVIVGDSSDGTSEYMSEVKSLIASSGHAERFVLAGYVEQVEPLYWATDIVVHASTEPEPCGMVIMEAMAARRPVIAADAGGPRELVRDGVDGRLTTPGQVDELRDAILEIAADPRVAARMGAHGYERARSLFDVPIAAGMLARIYASLSDGAELPLDAISRLEIAGSSAR